jgi:DNA polymerase III, alpha subunit
MIQLFSHLRVSSEYSISQGFLTVEQIVDNAIQNFCVSVAITEKLNMFGLVKFFNKCESGGIKLISGFLIKIIFDDDDILYELMCLVKINNGNKNL